MARALLYNGEDGHRRYWVLGALIFVIVLAGVAQACSSYTEEHTRTVMVCDKERVHTENGSQYRVYTDAGTYRMEDTFIGGVRFDTADAYGRLDEDAVYEITYYGWRFGLTSSFPNITEANELSEEAAASYDGSGC